jgi:homoserine/homoserine lactone efflux protein
VAYLVWLGLGALRPTADPGAIRPARTPTPGGRLVVQGFAVMMANPKAVLAVGAILPPFLDPDRPALLQVTIMAATICAGSILVHCGYIAAAGRLAAWRPFTARPRLMRTLAGLVYLAAAAALAAVGV